MTRRELFQRVTGAVLASGVAGLVKTSPASAAPLRAWSVGSERVFGGRDVIAESLALETHADGYERCEFDTTSPWPQIGERIAIDLPNYGVVFRGTVSALSMRSTRRSTFRTRVSAENVNRERLRGRWAAEWER